MPLLTIFTATYNREHLLQNLYYSLLHQTEHNFEWVIVDDGSTDNTETYVRNLIQHNNIPFKIIYFKQSNAGKHIAFNKGLELANGLLFFNIDSDDVLLEHAIATISTQWADLATHQTSLNLLAGIVFNKVYSDGSPVGTQNPPHKLRTTIIDYRYKLNIKGDKIEVFRTDIIRNYPFPTTTNEKFCPEALIWNRIGSKYEFCFYNIAIYMGEYLEGGLSSKIVTIRAKSPINATMYYAELTRYAIPFLQKIKAAINFWRFYYHCPTVKRQQIVSYPNSILNILSILFGYVMYKKEHKHIL